MKLREGALWRRVGLQTVMLSCQTALGGNGAMATCVNDTYYGSGKDQAWRNLYEALDTFSDKKPEAILSLLAKKASEK